MPRPLVRASSRRYATRSTLLPETVHEAFTRFFARAKGVAILMIAIAFAVAMITHDPEDPSSNAAMIGTMPIHNWLGITGSYVSDIVWQLFGIAGILFSVIVAAWGWCIASERGLALFGGRILAGIVSVLSVSIAMSALYPDGAKVKHAGMMLTGGTFGKLLSDLGLLLIPAPVGNIFIAILAFVIATATLYLASALTIDEWQTLWYSFRNIVAWTYEKISMLFWALWDRIHREKRYDDEIDEDEKAQANDDEDEEETEDEDEEDEEEPPVKDGKIFFSRKKKPALVQRPTNKAKQTKLALRGNQDFPLPPLEILSWPEDARTNADNISEEALEKNAKLLESTLADFGVNGRITKVSPGPVVTLYELEPSPGTRAARVISLADDIARNMSAVSVRVAVVSGRNAIGIELPNRKREMVFLRELFCSDAYTDTKGTLPIVLGKDIAGNPIIADLARMPHLLIAGTTGSGKSVAINTMILSLLYRLPPQKCRFIMVDPKMLELSVYEGIPHLLAPVVTEPKKAIMALKWTVREMEERYRSMSKLGVRNIEGYNMRLKAAAKNGENLMRTVQTGYDKETGKPTYEEQPLDLTELPYIVVIVDEMADLMLVAGKDIEGAIQRLAQMARAAGIHILMATQRPSVDVITGTIKANFPTRISFQVTSKIDSRTILGEQGAEQLLGMGDMLYMAGGGRITRVHGPFVSDDEVEDVVKYLKQQGEPDYLTEVTEDDEMAEFESEEGSGGFGGGGSGGSNDLFDKAVDIVLRERKASISFVQRHLQIGYNRAATLIERMEREGIIGAANHVGKREILGRKPDDD